MASNLLSRLLPPTAGSRSIYETLRQDEDDEASDLEEQAGLALDEENLGNNFHDYDAEDALAQATDSHIISNKLSEAAGVRDSGVAAAAGSMPSRTGRNMAPKWMRQSVRAGAGDEADDEVPMSLLIEDGREIRLPDPPSLHDGGQEPEPAPTPAPGASNRETRQRWKETQTRQRLHDDRPSNLARIVAPVKSGIGLTIADRRQKALWRWATVGNLDNHLKNVYSYYLGKGMWSIILSRALNLLTLLFVIGFTTFLYNCVDYRKVPKSKMMSEIIVPQCTKKMSTTSNLLIWIFSLFWIMKLFEYVLDFRRLRHMHDFYEYLLDISDTDIQTISWQEVVARLMKLRDANPETAAALKPGHNRLVGSQSKQRMDAHDIANRLMRKENYVIALINKDILDLTLPIPFLRNRQLFSRTLEWNLTYCIIDFVFNDQGQVNSKFLKDTHRHELSKALRARFIFAGFMNIFIAPFLVSYYMVHVFFRYFNEYQRNPSQIGSRSYTPLAEWKFREFNELYHLFQRRINMSYPFASRYIDQFPKDKTVQLARFVAFITGALASVLALATVVDHEMFLGFEITPDRTVLFYLSIFGTIWAVTRGIVPEENFVFDPEFAMHEVMGFTHYRPTHWEGRLHSDEVRSDFATLYKMKAAIFLEEILSMIITPFVLWFSLPTCSDRVIDFFREFTIHVDGLGYVCSFAVFDFKRGSNATQLQSAGGKAGEDLRDDYYATKDNKMLASYYGFLDDYGTNPRHGTTFRQPSRKRFFHPPPEFPGPLSPTRENERYDSRSGGHDSWRARQRSTGRAAPTAAAQAPRFSSAEAMSPAMPSILLDPHHQPSTLGFRSLGKPAIQSRHKPARLPVEAPIEDADENMSEPPKQPQRQASFTPFPEESNLGDSWGVANTGAAEEDDEEDNPGGRDNVLNLAYMMSRARPIGRGAGVNL